MRGGIDVVGAHGNGARGAGAGAGAGHSIHDHTTRGFMHGEHQDVGRGAGRGGGEGICGGDGGGGDGGAGGVFDAGDDERDDHPSPLFPLFSPPRVGFGGDGGGGGIGGIGGIGGAGGGGRLSPTPSIGMSPSTLHLGLLNSVSPSMLLGTGAGAWLGGGATGGVGGIGGGGTMGAFGMSTGAGGGPSLIQTSQLAPFLLSQMGQPGGGSWGKFFHRKKGNHMCFFFLYVCVCFFFKR